MAKKTTFCRACTVCRHPDRMRIEMLRLAGTTADVLADRFDLKRDAIYRHMQNHVDNATRAQLIADVPLRELAERAANEGGSLLDYLSVVRSTVISQMLGAASINDAGGTAMLAGKAVDVLKEIGRLTGELLRASPVTINNYSTNVAFLQSPAFNRLETMLLERLAPFPDALRAVVGGLDALEHEDAAQGAPSAPVIEAEAMAYAA